jgi:2,3-bisphosphoglycerate-independent phosphoglycerate mutase
MNDKILMIILDGASDRPVNGITPLQHAETPNLDEIASLGISGIIDPIAPGIRPGSDVAHLSLLGYDPYEVYTGRGPFEAAGVGIDVKPGDIAFRCNFATVDNGIAVDRRAGRIRGTKELAKAIGEVKIDDVEIIFKGSTEHRAAMVIRGDGLSQDVIPNDPAEDGRHVCKIEAINPEAERTAKILNKFVEETEKILEEHEINRERREKGEPPANYILFRGVGEAPKLERFDERYGLKGGVIAAVALVIGIGRMCGMEYIKTEGATGDVHSDVRMKMKNAVRALEDHDFILMNIKGTDEMGHDGDFLGKSDFIQRIDESLAEIMDIGALVVITADHSTPVSVGGHSADPVPVVMKGEGVRVDDVKAYDEISSAKGGLLRIRGMNLLPILADLTNRAKKFGA